jgi:hypothetical protein
MPFQKISNEYRPSDAIEAPDNLNNSDPIWIGKTFSAGRIDGVEAWDFPRTIPGGLPAPWLPEACDVIVVRRRPPLSEDFCLFTPRVPGRRT